MGDLERRADFSKRRGNASGGGGKSGGSDMRRTHVTINILSVYTSRNSRAYVRN